MARWVADVFVAGELPPYPARNLPGGNDLPRILHSIICIQLYEGGRAPCVVLWQDHYYHSAFIASTMTTCAVRFSLACG